MGGTGWGGAGRGGAGRGGVGQAEPDGRHHGRCPQSCGNCGRRALNRATMLPDETVDSRGRELPFHSVNGVIVDSRGRAIPMPAKLESDSVDAGVVAGLAVGGLCLIALALAVAMAVRRRRSTNTPGKATEMGSVAAEM